MGASGSKANRRTDHKALNTRQIKKLIRNRQLAPLFVGQDENTGQLDECPICLLNFPALNLTDGCCGAAICTDCYLKVLYSRSEEAVQQCPFCNKPGYKVVYHGPKTEAARAAERHERDTVEHALVSARLEEEQLAEQRRLKRASEGNSMTPEEGSLAAEWARAQEEDRRFMEQREAYWREAIARHAADGGSDYEMDVEDLLMMQAMLASLEDQQLQANGEAPGAASSNSNGGGQDHEAAGSSAHGRSDATAVYGSSAAADDGPSLDSHAAASALSTHFALADEVSNGGGGGADGSGSHYGEAQGTQEPQQDFRLHPPANSSAEPVVGGSTEAAAAATFLQPTAAGSSIRLTAAAAGDVLPPCSTGSDVLGGGAPAEPSRNTASAPEAAAIPAPQQTAFLGSPALAQALAEANGGRGITAAHAQLFVQTPATQSAGGPPLLTAAELGSTALVDALPATNSWAAEGQRPSSQQAAPGSDGQPIVIGMVLVQQGPSSGNAATPRTGNLSNRGVIVSAGGDAAAASAVASAPQPPSSSGVIITPTGAAGSSEAAETPTVGPLGGVALMRQPDQSIVLVLLRSGDAQPAASEASSQDQASDVPLLELSYEDPVDRQIVDAILSGDALVQRAFQRMSDRHPDADEAFRIAMEQHAATDAARQQALLVADARLKAALEAADARTSVMAH